MGKTLNGGNVTTVNSLEVTALLPNETVKTDATSTLDTITNGTPGQVLTAQITGPPAFENTGAQTSTVNIANGAAGDIPYQIGPSITTFVSVNPGVLVGNAIMDPPAYTNNPTVNGITLSALPADRAVSTGGGGTLTTITNGTVGQLLTANVSGAPTFQNVANPNVNVATGILPVGNGGTGANTTAANSVFIGPSALPGVPTFRGLQNADIPVIVQALARFRELWQLQTEERGPPLFRRVVF